MLCVVLVFLPEIVFWLFGLQQNDVGDFLAKRAGVLFFGYSLLCFCTRNSTSSQLQAVVSLVIGATLALMAIMGIYEYARGYAGIGILVAVVIELLMAYVLTKHWVRTKFARVSSR